MYFAYCLVNSDGKIYIGQTNNLDRRLLEHNDPLQSKKRRFTKNKGPWKIIYKEEFKTRNEALAREKYLKSHQGRDWLRNFGAIAQW